MPNRTKVIEDGRVWELTDIKVDTYNKHPDYIVNAKNEALLGPTGAWDFVSFQHLSGWPVYKARWDEKQSALDIDKLVNNSTRHFKRFAGHHTKRAKDDLWEFEIEINDAGAEIFRGSVRFHVTRRVTTCFDSKVGFACEAEVIPAPPKSHKESF